jgi:hypothetical protein
MLSLVYINENVSNNAIVFSDDDDNKSWCDQYDCGGLLIECKDQSMVCSLCQHVYSPNSTTLHKARLQPNKNRYNDEREGGALLVSMTSYAD